MSLPLVLLLACVADLAPLDSGLAIEPSPALAPVRAERPNILVVVVDDFGVDASGCYDLFDVHKAPQPTLKSLCRNGVVFERAWANPLSSPTRAGMLTGRDAWRTMVGEPVDDEAPGLPADELLLPAALDELGAGHAHAAFGKWHLADDLNGGDEHPNLAGFAHYAGGIEAGVDSYDAWEKVIDGSRDMTETYATTDTVDDAIGWLDEQDGPWFLWLAFNAPHSPIHLPPATLHSYDDLDEYEEGDDPVPYYLATIEAMDTELGRLLDHMSREERDNTWIIYVGDNGTWAPVNQDAYLDVRSKGSLFQGGVHVPMVVVGPGLDSPGRREDALVGTVDIFSTVIELAGGDPSDLGVELDSVSMLPYLRDADAVDQRRHLLVEVFGPKTASNHAGRAITDGRWKYLRKFSGAEFLFDLDNDPREARNLADSVAVGPARARARLGAYLDARPVDEWWAE